MTDKKPKVSKYEELYGPIADRYAIMYGLDPTLFRNQLRQESGFNPKAKSGVGALGIGQLMTFHRGKYGLNTETDFYNPEKNINAAAQMMSQLTKTYGDQRLALAAYNGGGGSIEFVKQKLGKKDINYDDWTKFMAKRRLELGNSPTAWHGQTLDYVNRIAGGVNTPTPSPKPSKEVPTTLIAQSQGAKFDFIEELARRQQADPSIEHVQEPVSSPSIAQQPQLPPDTSHQDRVNAVIAAYQKQMKEQLLKSKQQQEQQLAEQKRQQVIQGITQLTQGLSQPQTPIQLEGYQSTPLELEFGSSDPNQFLS
jgi:hypothetical protein